ncbi:MAG: hypothetical protein FWF75_06995, partial [Propionibacteriaceae bacterium]|nr:hypothetical protein [Propionibacteriaceae bacterium]
QDTGRTAETFNLTVSGPHTYYVGTDTLLVHNCGGSWKLSSPKAIADRLGYTVKQIKDAIHAVKNAGKIPGALKNADVMVDQNGEVYPILPNGEPAEDSIGNIFDILEGG